MNIYDRDTLVAYVRDGQLVPAGGEHEDEITSWLEGGVPCLEGDVQESLVLDAPSVCPPDDPFFDLALMDHIDRLGWRLGDDVDDAFFAVAHAPAGYTKANPLVIQGKKYVGGQFIPGGVLAKATKEEKAKIKESRAEPESGERDEHGRMPKWMTSAVKGALEESGTTATENLAGLLAEFDDKLIENEINISPKQLHDTLSELAAKEKPEEVIELTEADVVEEPEKPKAEPTKPQSTKDWKKIGGQKGSNPGGLFQTPDKQKYYVKFSKSPDHAKNEVLAAKLYEAAGAPVPVYDLVDTPQGLGTASKWLEDTDAFNPKNPQDIEAAVENFGVHAWLGNYDAIGTSFDNQVWSGDKLVTIDTGGSLLYRAQGKPKGTGGTAPFDEDLAELSSMTKQGNAGTIFGEMTPMQKLMAFQKVKNVKPDQIEELVEKFGPGTEAEKAKLLKTLLVRQKKIADVADALSDALVSSGELLVAEEVKESEEPKTTAEELLGLPPKAEKPKVDLAAALGPMSVPPAPIITSPSNLSHQKKLNAIFDAAQTGDVAAVEAIPTNATSGQTYVKKVHQYKQAVLLAMKYNASQPAAPEPKSEPKPKTPPSPKPAPTPAPKPAAKKAEPKKAEPKPPKIDASKFPDDPVFKSSNAKNVSENKALVEKIKEMAKAGDLAGLQSVTSPSPLISGSYLPQVIEVLDKQLNPPLPPKEYKGQLHKNKEAHPNAKVAKAKHVVKVGEYYILTTGAVPDVSFQSHYLDKKDKSHGSDPYKLADEAENKKHLKAFKAMPEYAQKRLGNLKGSNTMNENFWKGETSHDDLKILGKALMEHAPELPVGTQLRRYVGLKTVDAKKLAESVGAMVQEPSFSETSAKRDWDWPTPGETRVKWQFTSAPGAKGLYINDAIKSHDHEMSTILPPGQRYLITKAMWVGKTLQLDAILMPTIPEQFNPDAK